MRGTDAPRTPRSQERQENAFELNFFLGGLGLLASLAQFQRACPGSEVFVVTGV